MATPTFEEMVVAERKRLTEALVDIDTKIAALNVEASALKKELSALDAYEAAKTGKPTVQKLTGSRPPRGSRQQSLLGLIAAYPDGIGRGGILEQLGLKGDKAGESSTSNALNTLKKAGKLASKGGLYTVI